MVNYLNVGKNMISVGYIQTKSVYHEDFQITATGGTEPDADNGRIR